MNCKNVAISRMEFAVWDGVLLEMVVSMRKGVMVDVGAGASTLAYDAGLGLENCEQSR